MDAYVTSTTRIARRRPESLDKIKKSARKLFVERGYHATRPQDIARDANLGHGTFYLHYEDKRACFQAFIEDTCTEFSAFMKERVGHCLTIEDLIGNTLEAVYDYSDANPGVLDAAMAGEALIDARGRRTILPLQRWGRDWARAIKNTVGDDTLTGGINLDILGQAIAGAIYQASLEGDRLGVSRTDVVCNLTRFLARGFKP